jgi:hypothetical protein
MHLIRLTLSTGAVAKRIRDFSLPRRAFQGMIVHCNYFVVVLGCIHAAAVSGGSTGVVHPYVPSHYF